MDYERIADKLTIGKTAGALEKKGYRVTTVADRVQALEKIKNLIPGGKTVMTGASVTLEQIGFIDYLNSDHNPWINFHKAITAEADADKRHLLRRQSLTADYYLGSVHALGQNGEFIVASNTGSQLPHIAYSSPNLIFVVGCQKIVPDMNTAMKRLKEYVVPLEDKRMRQKFGIPTMLAKILIFREENKTAGRTVNFILVKEKLGF